METEYSKAYYKAIGEERTRIARELHDGPIQTMTHIGHKLEFVQALLAKQAVEAAQIELRQARVILQTCLHSLRNDISLLMTTNIAPQDIGNALQALLDEYRESESTLKFTYTLDTPTQNILEQLPAPVIHPLFRFVQEALHNVRKHAQATTVNLHVYSNATSLLAEVCDNGIGVTAAAQQQDKKSEQHMGMRIMRNRVQEVGGSVEFESSSGKGTCVRAIFPLVVA